MPVPRRIGARVGSEQLSSSTIHKTCDLEDAMALQAAEKAGEGSFSSLEGAGWIALAIYLVLVVGFAWNPTPFAQGLAALGISIACAHAVLFYGWKDELVLLAIRDGECRCCHGFSVWPLSF
jgi:hypothetical protein